MDKVVVRGPDAAETEADAKGESPAETSAPKPDQNTPVSDMIPRRVQSGLRPASETKRAEVTRPAETAPQAVPPDPIPAPREKAAPQVVAEQEPRDDEWKPLAAKEGEGEADQERERERPRRRRSSGGRSMPVFGFIPPFMGGGSRMPFGDGGGSGAGGNQSGGASFGEDAIPQPSFGEAGPDSMADSQFNPDIPLGEASLPTDGTNPSEYPPEYEGGNYTGGFGDDLAETTDSYPDGSPGPPGTPGGPTTPMDGGLQPSEPLPPPPF